jgi:hypothetical protein
MHVRQLAGPCAMHLHASMCHAPAYMHISAAHARACQVHGAHTCMQGFIHGCVWCA